MSGLILEPQTFAAYIPTCKECGSRDTTFHFDTTTGKSKLRCGHAGHIVLIPNPALSGDSH